MKVSRRQIGATALAAFALLIGLLPIPAHRAFAQDGSSTIQNPLSIVQIVPAAIVGTGSDAELWPAGWGTGTIVSQDGLILTSHHLVDFEALSKANAGKENVEILTDGVFVFVTDLDSEDSSPVPGFFAVPVPDGDFPDLDLSLLRIVADASGSEVDTTTLNLPFAPLGDSDVITANDEIFMLGYPDGIGEPISYTTALVTDVVSGTTAQKNADAWITLDTAIPNGWAGGPAGFDTEEGGLLIGVPTLNADDITCEPLGDTNADGDVTEDDLCIPFGPDTNQVRPINLVKSTIEELASSTTITGTNNPTNTIQLSGTIIDGNTGDPIAGASFAVLQAGVTWDDYANDPSDDKFLDLVITDSNGEFVLTQPLERGQTYSMGAQAEGYDTFFVDGVEITDDVPDEASVEISLQPSQ